MKEVPSADVTKIGMYGWSRGGMMTFRALLEADMLKAAVVGGALSDCFSTIKNRPEMETNVFQELIPNYSDNRLAELDKRSAIKWVDKFPKDDPILMLHGNSDRRVNPKQSLNLATEFEKYRVPYRLIMYEGEDHAITEHKSEVNEQVFSWFETYLKNSGPLPDMNYHGN